MNLIEKIEKAFSHRKSPRDVVEEGHPQTDIYESASHFSGLSWRDITCDLLDQHHDAIFGFNPDAFCYYLPGIYIAGIKENRGDLLIYSTLVNMLDRSNTPNSWDDFFIERWAALTDKECQASQEWLVWLSAIESIFYYGNELSRAFDTLEIICTKQRAVPLAKGSEKN